MTTKRKRLIGLILIVPLAVYMWTLSVDVFFNDFPVYKIPYSVLVITVTIWLTAFMLDMLKEMKNRQ